LKIVQKFIKTAFISLYKPKKRFEITRMPVERIKMLSFSNEKIFKKKPELLIFFIF